MIGSRFSLQFMGDSTTTDLVVEEVEEKDKSGDENGKKPDADKKLAKEKTKLTEKKGLKRSGEELGGGDPKTAKNAFNSKSQWTNWSIDCELRRQSPEWRTKKSWH